MPLKVPTLKLPTLRSDTVRRARRKIRQYRLNRKRSRVARRKTAGTRKATFFLTVILLALFGAFGWAQSYLTTPAQGTEISIDELRALAKENRIVDGTFYDEDNRLAGTFVAESLVEEEEPKDEKSKSDDKNKGDEPKNKGDEPKNKVDGDKEKPDKAGSKPTEDVSVAPVGAGEYWLAYPSSDAAFGVLSDILDQADARIEIDQQSPKGVVRVVSTYLLPLLILANFFGLLFTAGRGSTSGIGDVIAFGVLGNKRQKKGFTAPVTFGDVGGAEEAVAELVEVVDYLRDPERYEELKAAPPKGVLLFGPPGCGKTLMAKAVAGEAGVPFFSVSGAEFVESLVGVGAARVRDLFQQVRQVAPAIVFIDELDAAGRKRGAGGAAGGGSDEREQTLNQLLVEMDGFGISEGIVVIGATNRPDILDPALLRPGRFDRHITVEQPDLFGREEILLLHARGKPLADDVDFAYLARRTPGFSGADLANVINEAALLTVRSGKEQIHLSELEEAILRVLHGPKRKGRMVSPEERARVGYHESGHAIVAAAIGNADDVHRISILDRGKGLGSSAIHRAEESILTADQLYEKLVITMAGMASEKLVLGQPSTGVEDDLEQATTIARDMVGRFGLSELGSVRLLASDAEMFLGNASAIGEVSEATLRQMDTETRRFVDSALADATLILEQHRADLDALVERLLAQETIEGKPLSQLLSGVAPTPVRFPATRTIDTAKGDVPAPKE
ncbi:MAG TPA: ATP-dependent zinc metalloprotease FtsH [Actinomycetota bacterium]|nr:ATP-dependent zinc metalloprotease FtsH [Actinomycetota bacterium]